MTADFWGSCYGGGRFIVVGTGGTIVTSPDGATWSTRVSGTAEWLLAVAYSDSLYAAVGDHGTILTSSDGVTWTPRSSGTSVRLNGIAFGGGRFLAVGENGVVTTSSDGVNWQAANTGSATFLRAVVYGQNRFVLGGGAGTLFSTTDGQHFARLGIATRGAIEALAYDGAQFTAVGEFSNLAHTSDLKNWTINTLSGSYLRGVASVAGVEIAAGSPVYDGSLWVIDSDRGGSLGINSGVPAVQLNAVAANGSSIIAVGLTGTICRWVLPVGKPDWVQISVFGLSNTDVYRGYVGQRATLVAFAAPPSSTKRTFQWSRNGAPIAGATSPTLVISQLKPSDAGRYDITVTSSDGSVSTSNSPATLVVEPAPLEYGSRDRSFVSPVTSSPTAIAVQPDGRIIVAAPMFFYPREIPQFGLARLLPDGSLDETFQLPSGGLAFDSVVNSIEVISDGRIAVHTPTTMVLNSDGSLAQNSAIPSAPPLSIPLNDGRSIEVLVENNVLTLTRRIADGSVDPSYATVALSLGPLLQHPEYLNFSSFVYARDAHGRFLVATSSLFGSPPGGVNEAKLVRLLPDGTLDASFPLATINNVPITEIVPLEDYIYYGSRWQDSWWAGGFNYTFGRLHSNGTADPTYHPIGFFTSGTTGRWPVAELCPDGSVVAATSFDTLARIRGIETSYDTRLVNLSVRTTAGTGDQTLIVGFVVAGSGGTRSVLTRGIGPGLVPLGLSANEVIADPRLTLYHGSLEIKADDDWDASLAGQFSAVGAFPLAAGSKDAALLSDLAPGAYTAHITAASGNSGIALVELYDASAAPTSFSTPRLVNVSGRARVGTGNNVLIAGFVVGGSSSKRVLVRAMGPSLQSLGVSDVLADPKLTVHKGQTIIAENDDWDYVNVATFRDVGAFMPTSPKDSAIVLDLSPGVYSAVVAGANNASGVALVEIYEVP